MGEASKLNFGNIILGDVMENVILQVLSQTMEPVAWNSSPLQHVQRACMSLWSDIQNEKPLTLGRG